MKNISVKYTLKALSIVISAALFSCTGTQEESMEDSIENDQIISFTEEQHKLAGIEMGKIVEKQIGTELQVNGIIDVPPQSNISINTPYGGFIYFIDLLPGSPVKKGQLLVSIKNPDFIQFQQEYLENLAQRDFLKAEFERQSKLFDEKVASGKSYQEAKSKYDANEARIRSMAEKLSMIGISTSKVEKGSISSVVNIYSPVTGYVREIYSNTGRYVNPQDIILDITNTDDLHVELTVYENDIPKIKKGQRIRFSIANNPDSWLEAEVFLIGSGVRENRSVTVHGHLHEKNEDLLPGMYVQARIETGSHNAQVVPEQAVVRFNAKHYIFESLDKSEGMFQFVMHEVEVGASEDEFVQITLPNYKGDINKLNVVTKGAFAILAKAKNTEEEE